ncbi:MAG: UDP-glucuronic acid decarboxylase family protein [Candidatus Omnitrophota bacterium]
MRKKTVLITGGAGFLGSHLCDAFIRRDFKVICMDNLITGALKNIRHLKKNKNFRFINHNVSKTINVKDPLDFVLHFASPASPIDYLNFPIQTLKVGALGTHNTLGVAKAKKARYLLASTSEVYGDPKVHPQKESYWGHVNPIGPRGVYDEAKRFAEAMTMAYHRVHKIDTRIVRIFNTYGPRMRLHDGRVVPAFIDQILHHKPLTVFGNGLQTRSFCYVSDLINGIIKLLFSNYTQPVNIGNPREFTILQFAKLISKITCAQNKIVYKPLPVDDPKVRRPDITLAKKKLDWSPKVSLKEGLQITVDWFKNKTTTN